MKEIQLDGQSPDIAEENIQKLKALFPEIVTEERLILKATTGFRRIC